MHRYPCSWLNLFAKLGFKRKQSKKQRGNSFDRKPKIESLERREMLAADVVAAVTVVETVVAADFNIDSNVDAVDLSIWETGFGTSSNATYGQGDSDGDGDVDGFDFLSWQRRFNQSTVNLVGAGFDGTDFDGDGREDLAVFHPEDNTLVAVLEGGGRISFEFDPSPPLADFTGDLTVDGADLSVWETGFGSTSASHSEGDADRDGDVDGFDFLAWQRGVGTTLVPETYADFQTGDFNGDGRDDLAVRNVSDGQWSILLSESTQFLVQPTGVSTNWLSNNIFVGDFDGDGSEELLGRANTSSSWEVLQFDEATGVAIETGWGSTLTGGSFSAIDVEDVNRDGRDDLVGSSGANLWVSLSQSGAGGSFSSNQLWSDWFNGSPSANAQIEQLIDIFSDVYNTIELELYPGLLKGIEATAATKAGNPWDQAALLVDRLEQAGFEADIATGRVEALITELQQWLGTETPVATASVIAGSLDGLVALGSQSNRLEFTHAWVRARVPTENGLEWVDLDPSWKFKDRQPGIDVDLASSNGTFDELDFLALDPASGGQTPLEYYADAVQEFLTQNTPGSSLADVPRDGPILTKVFDEIPAGLGTGVTIVGSTTQYENFQFIVDSPTLRDELTHRFDVVLERETSTQPNSETITPTTGNLVSYDPNVFDFPPLPSPPDVWPANLTVNSFQPYGNLDPGPAPPPTSVNFSSASQFASYTGVDPEAFEFDVDLRSKTFNSYFPLDDPYFTEASFPGALLTSSLFDTGGSAVFQGEDLVLSTSFGNGLVAKAIQIQPHQVTSDTQFGLTFSSTDEGLLHGIGWAKSLTNILPGINSQFVNLHGSITGSILLSQIANASNPLINVPTGGSASGSIGIGSLWGGTAANSEANYLIFFTESQDFPGQSANSTFSDMSLFESPSPYNGSFTHSSFDQELDLVGGNDYKTLGIDAVSQGGDEYYPLTPNTVLEFEFRSSVQGEVHAIGWDTDDNLDDADSNVSHIYQLYGTDATTYADHDFDTYSTPGQYVPFTIPIGEDISVPAGQAILLRNLVFINEDGTDPFFQGGPVQHGTSSFRNIRLYELPFGDVELTSDDDGDTAVKLTGTARKTLDISNYTITPDTTLNFTFSSESEGLLHRIGWDVNSTYTSGDEANWFSVYGTNLPGGLPYTTYNGSGADQQISIPIGNFVGAAGNTISHLVFTVDDGQTRSDAESIFSDIEIVENGLSGDIAFSAGQLTLTGTAFKTLDISNYSITVDTALRFSFRSGQQGGAHWIGWDTDNNYVPSETTSALFQVYGTNTNPDANASAYLYDGNGTDSLTIPIGQYLNAPGNNIQHLLFGVEGGAIGSTVESIFSQVELFEDRLAGTATVNGSNELLLTGKAYKAINFNNYTITPNTKLKFDFRSTQEGVSHGILLDTDLDYDSNEPVLNLYGTNGATLPEYEYTSLFSWQSFDIPIGLLSGFDGTFDEIIFFADGGTNIPGANSWFRNIQLYEEVGTAGIHLSTGELVVAEHSLDSILISYDRQDGATALSVDDQYRARIIVGADDGVGDDQATGEEFFLPGDATRIILSHYAPTSLLTPSQLEAADQDYTFLQEPGEIVAIALDANQYSRGTVADLQSVALDILDTLIPKLENDSETEQELIDGIGSLLAVTGARYWQSFNEQTEAIAGLTGTVLTQIRVGSGVVTAQPWLIPFDVNETPGNLSDDVRVVEHLNYGIAPFGMGIDLPNINQNILDPTSGFSDDEAFQLAGYHSSSLEHTVVEEAINSESISTVKGLLNAFQKNLGVDGNSNSVTDDRIYYFRREVGGTIKYLGDWYQGSGTPNLDQTVTTAQVASMLAGHAVAGSGSNKTADAIVDILDGTDTSFTGEVTIAIPRYKSNIGFWIGSVYVVESADRLLYAIAEENGPVTNGGFSGDKLNPFNFDLPVGIFPSAGYAGDPVNTANGNMFRDDVDIVYPNLGVSLSFARHYDSQSQNDVGLGVGWTFSFGDVLIEDPANANDLIWITAGGGRHTFAWNGSGYDVPTALHGEFTDDASTFFYKDKDGLEYHFEKISANENNLALRGRLIKQIDNIGNGVDITYTAGFNRRIAQVRDVHDVNRRLDFSYLASQNAIGSVERFVDGNTQGVWSYLYTFVSGTDANSNWRLASVTAPSIESVPDGTTTPVTSSPVLTYSSYSSSNANAGLIQRITEVDGQWHEFEYFANGRVFRVTDNVGNTEIFSYNLFRNLTEFTDQNGNTEIYIHQDNGLTTKQIHADGTQLEYTWGAIDSDEEFLMQTSTDQLGRTEIFTYYNNSLGQIEEYLSRDGLLTRFEYVTPANRPHISRLSKTTVDPDAILGNSDDVVTQFTYDAEGRLLTTIDAENNATTRTYYADTHATVFLRGLLESQTSPRNLETVFQYDTAGNVVSAATEGLPTSTLVYDHNGNPISVTDATGVVTESTYDILGRLLESGLADPDGTGGPLQALGSTFQYDIEGRLRLSTDPLGQTTEWKYDLEGNLAEQISADGSSVTFAYDALGNRTSQTDALGRTTRFVYDSRSRLIQTVHPDGASEQVRYDSVGRVVASVDALGRETQLSYDEVGRLLTTTNAANDTATNVYDALGNLTFSVDRLGNTVERKYDKLGRVVETRALATLGPLAALSTIDYDADGNVIQVATYDTIGLDAASIAIPADPRTLITTANQTANLVQTVDFEYDNLNRLIETTYADGTSTTTIYDAAGRTRFQLNELSRVTELRYDAYGRLSETVLPDPDGGGAQSNPITTFEYDAASNQTAIIDPRGFRTEFQFDQLNRAVKIVDAEGGVQRSIYDTAGQLVSTINALGHATYTVYDKRGRATTIRSADPDGVGPLLASETRFEYDAVGNLVRQTDPRGFVTNFEYDELNRLEREEFTVTQIDEAASTTQNTVWIETLVDRNFTYDNNGNLLSETDTLGRTTDFTYDELNRLETARLPDPNGVDANGVALPRLLTTTTYDGFGNVISTLENRGGQNRETVWVYDRRNRLFSETLDAGGSQEVATAFEYDNVGNLTKTFEAVGTINAEIQFFYDNLNRLQATHSFPGGGALQLITSLEYDEASNLTKSTDSTIAFVSSVFLSHTSATTFQYDKLGRQTSITRDAGGDLESISSVQYDAIGNVVRQIDPLRRTTVNEYDRLSRLIKTTAPDPDAAGPLASAVTTLVYDQVNQLTSQTNGEGETQRFVYDSLGRLVREFDALDAETRRAYDSEGNLTSYTDPEQNTTLYAYDDLNRLTAETIFLPGLVSRTSTYNAQGNLQETVDRNGRERQFVYDRLDRQTLEVWNDPALVGFLSRQYDALGRITVTQDYENATGSSRVNTFSYDDLGRVTAERNYDPNNLPLTTTPKIEQRYDYDVLDASDVSDFVRTVYSQELTTNGTNFTNVGTTTFFSDRLGRTAKLEDAGNLANGITDKTIEFNYDAADQRQEITRTANSGSFEFDTDYNYDGAGRVSSISHLQPTASSLPFTSLAYEYDRADRITQKTTAYDSALSVFSAVNPLDIEDFQFDLTGQLTSATGGATGDEAFAYDDNGNRTSGGSTTDPHNRLSENDEFTFQYDNEGNLTRKTAKSDGSYSTYAWDHRNRLTTVEDFSVGGVSQQTIEYQYNTDNQLVTRTVGGTIEHYVYDGAQRVLTLDDTGTLARRATWGPGVDQLLVDEVFNAAGQQENTLWAATDYLGSVNQLLDNTGTIVEHRVYESFGALDTVFDVAGAVKSSGALLSDIAFAGRFWDDQAGLYNNRLRWYDADTGRFIGEDPAEDGNNWYAYAGNNPITFFDPSGLAIASPLQSIGNFLGQTSNAFASGLQSTVSTVASFLPREPSFSETPGAFIEAIRQSNTTARRQERQLFEMIGGAPFTFDELQDSPNVRLVRNPNTNTAFNVIPFGITKGRDRFATDVEFEGNNFKVILGQAARPTGEGPPIATVQGVRRAPVGFRSDSVIAQEFFDQEQNAFTQASVTATVNSGFLALDAAMLGRASSLRPRVAPRSIATPFGTARQSASAEALLLRSQVESGQLVRRSGNFPRSAGSDAQFFSTENPLSRGFANRVGAGNLDASVPDFIMGGRVRPNGNFVTRSAPGVRSNAGGALEVVAEPGVVQFEFFVMPGR